MAVIEQRFIFLDKDFATQDEIFNFVAQELKSTGRADDAEKVTQGFYEREKLMSTYMEAGVCIPHCKSEAVKQATVVVVRSKTPVPWEGEDGTEQAKLLFFLAIPEQGSMAHLRILAHLAQSLLEEAFVEQIKQAATAEQAAALLEPINGMEFEEKEELI